MTIAVFNPDVETEEVFRLYNGIWIADFGRPLHEQLEPDLYAISETYEGFWIARRDDRLVAGIGVEVWAAEPRIVSIRRLYVAHGHRHIGIGPRLIRIALRYARPPRSQKVWTWTKPDNGEAQVLFAAFGFKYVPEGLPHPESRGKYCMELRF